MHVFEVQHCSSDMWGFQRDRLMRSYNDQYKRGKYKSSPLAGREETKLVALSTGDPGTAA